MSNPPTMKTMEFISAFIKEGPRANGKRLTSRSQAEQMAASAPPLVQNRAIFIPHPAGHWEVSALPAGNPADIRYAAELYINGCDEIACHAFALLFADVHDSRLLLDTTEIYLPDQETFNEVEQWLKDSRPYVYGGRA